MTIRTFLVRVLYIIVRPIRKFYWFIIRPKTYGVKVLIQHENKFLFIRNAYGLKKWTFPGGGLKRGEAPEQGGRREVFEEVGIVIKNILYMGDYQSSRLYKRDTIYGYYSIVDTPYFKIDSTEIEEAKWLSLDKIPKDYSWAVSDVLNLYTTWKKKN